MVKIIWTGRALKDLEEIGEYIAKDSLKYAKLTLEKLLETAGFIEQNQMIGRIVPEIRQKNIREIITGNYRIIYLIKKDQSFILTVHHKRRLLSNNPAFRKK